MRPLAVVTAWSSLSLFRIIVRLMKPELVSTNLLPKRITPAGCERVRGGGKFRESLHDGGAKIPTSGNVG